MLFGLPTTVFFVMFLSVAFSAMLFGLAFWLALLVAYPVLLGIARHDENAFRILGLALKTRLTNRNKKFWAGSSYAPTSYRKHRPWVRHHRKR